MPEPVSLPTWASNPGLDAADVVAPNVSHEDLGWPAGGPANGPVRQVLNGWMKLVGQWVAHLRPARQQHTTVGALADALEVGDAGVLTPPNAVPWSVRWSKAVTDIGSAVPDDLCCDGRRVYIASGGYPRALDAQSGAVVWVNEDIIGGAVCVCCDGASVYVGNAGLVRRLDPATGALLGSYSTLGAAGGAANPTALASDGTMVVIGQSDGSIVARSADLGTGLGAYTDLGESPVGTAQGAVRDVAINGALVAGAWPAGGGQDGLKVIFANGVIGGVVVGGEVGVTVNAVAFDKGHLLVGTDAALRAYGLVAPTGAGTARTLEVAADLMVYTQGVRALAVGREHVALASVLDDDGGAGPDYHWLVGAPRPEAGPELVASAAWRVGAGSVPYKVALDPTALFVASTIGGVSAGMALVALELPRGGAMVLRRSDPDHRHRAPFYGVVEV